MVIKLKVRNKLLINYLSFSNIKKTPQKRGLIFNWLLDNIYPNQEVLSQVTAAVVGSEVDGVPSPTEA